jgi:hypothetical protein
MFTPFNTFVYGQKIQISRSQQIVFLQRLQLSIAIRKAKVELIYLE